MSKQDYLASGALAFSAQLLTFKNAIGGYAADLGLTIARTTDEAADAE